MSEQMTEGDLIDAIEERWIMLKIDGDEAREHERNGNVGEVVDCMIDMLILHDEINLMTEALEYMRRGSP